jgi:hypothetical protein
MKIFSLRIQKNLFPVKERLNLAHPQFSLPCGFRVPPGGLVDPLSEAHQAAIG